MTKENPNNSNETKSDNFPWDIFKSNIIFTGQKILKNFNNFIIGIFQFHCKFEHKQVE